MSVGVNGLYLNSTLSLLCVKGQSTDFTKSVTGHGENNSACKNSSIMTSVALREHQGGRDDVMKDAIKLDGKCRIQD